MLTINKLLPRGQGLAAALLKRAATVTLDWDTRQKSRFDASDSQGRSLGVFLPRGSVVRGGDVLVAEDGSLIRVEAAAQPVLRITHCTSHGSSFDLLRAAYHLGNRHVPIELLPDHLQIEPDHVLADLLRQMHLIVTELHAPFEPEAGAYAAHGSPAAFSPGAHGHGHPDRQHGHGHDHSHDHAPAAKPAPVVAAVPLTAISKGTRPATPPHVHGPGCGHDHGHDHGSH
jgi:urease accessory protein